jgi:hypothetical protein
LRVLAGELAVAISPLHARVVRAAAARMLANTPLLKAAIRAVAGLVTPVDAAGWFKHCGVSTHQVA